MLRLLALASNSQRGVRLDTLSRDEWGDPATIRRMINTINQAWQESHQRQLLVIVDANGKPAIRGERYLRLIKPEVDRSKFHDFRSSRLAAFPAVFEFLKVIEHTIIEQELLPFYESMRQDLNSEDRRRLDRLRDKFTCASRGAKVYKAHQDVLDEVYDSLLREAKLKIKTSSKGKERDSTVHPLGLVHYSNGLYLIAHFDSQSPDDEPYKFKLETIREATSLKDQPFKYPANFKLKERFAGEFGIFFDAKAAPVEVELVFKADAGVKAAVQQRVYTKADKYEELQDGRLVLKFEARGLNEVTSWVLSWGGHVRVRRPEALRREVESAAKAILGVDDAS